MIFQPVANLALGRDFLLFPLFDGTTPAYNVQFHFHFCLTKFSYLLKSIMLFFKNKKQKIMLFLFLIFWSKKQSFCVISEYFLKKKMSPRPFFILKASRRSLSTHKVNTNCTIFLKKLLQ